MLSCVSFDTQTSVAMAMVPPTPAPTFNTDFGVILCFLHVCCSAGSVQQQIRSTPGTSQQAPKVLVSVDEAESTAAQLQRQNSAKKQ